jgi:hypothetical protein
MPLRRTAQELLQSMIRNIAEKRLRLVNQTRCEERGTQERMEDSAGLDGMPVSNKSEAA